MLKGIKTILFDLGGTLKISGQWELYPDTLSNIERLANAYDLVIAANQPAITQEFLEKTGLATHFSHTYLSESIGKAKPTDEFFEHIIADMGLDCKQTMMVGDSLAYDILPAHHCGLRTVWIKRDSGLAWEIEQGLDREIWPDYTIKSLPELI
jgi:putative hydrolase of the HAD superfamily